MKKSLLLITMLLLSAAWVVAQSTSPAPSPSQPSASDQSSQSSTGDQAKATAKADNTIRGCLSGSAGSYTLTDNASGKSYKLTGSDADLSAHIGQEVELNGSSATASAGMNGSAASNPSSSASSNPADSAASSGTSGVAEASNFSVKSVTKIADTCSNK